eukprot:10797476-Lingulodinium_polyedra.AAC.1
MLLSTLAAGPAPEVLERAWPWDWSWRPHEQAKMTPMMRARGQHADANGDLQPTAPTFHSAAPAL